MIPIALSKNLTTIIAADLGASGGKMVAAGFDGQKLVMDDYITFANRPVQVIHTLYWDVFSLYQSILDGFSYYTAQGPKPCSAGIDTWGATYGFLDKMGRLLEPVYHYRDARTATTMDALFKKVSQQEIFRITGCQCNRTYTLPQLYSCVLTHDPCLAQAEKMLFLPDLLGYFLSGEISNERTIAGTSALLTPSQKDWAIPLFTRLGIPTHFLTSLVEAGSVKGKLTPNVANSTGMGNASLVATTSHDSAAAVAAIPGFGPKKLYISIGTNVSMGIEQDAPLVNQKAFRGGLKNTGGMGNKKIIYRDFAAFWIINQLCSVWQKEGVHYSFDDLHTLAAQAKSPNAFIDTEYPAFNTPGGNMQHKITQYLTLTKQPIPETPGQWVLSIFESIALKTMYVASIIQDAANLSLSEGFVVNGGSRNSLLVQLISNALQLPIQAGMPYATLGGNLLTQLFANGYAASITEMRHIASNTFTMKEYLPQKGKDWNHHLQLAITKGVFPPYAK